MRIRFWDRLLIAVSGLLIVLAAVGLFVFGVGLFPVKLDLSMLEGPFEVWQRAVTVAVSVLLLALGLHGICLLFRRRRDKGFIIQHTEYGDMSISMTALESMVKKCVDAHDELSINTTRIHREREGIMVELRITLKSGANIPLTVNALQKQIKQYITSCSGVDVHKVRVMVETDTARLAAPAPVEMPNPQSSSQTESKLHESLAKKIFHHKEEPSSYSSTEEAPAVAEPVYEPAPVVAEPTAEAAPSVELEAESADKENPAEEAGEAVSEEAAEEADVAGCVVGEDAETPVGKAPAEVFEEERL